MVTSEAQRSRSHFDVQPSKDSIDVTLRRPKEEDYHMKHKFVPRASAIGDL